MMDTVWAALTLHGKNVDELDSRQKQTIERIVARSVLGLLVTLPEQSI